jgi:hypothetical protein
VIPKPISEWDYKQKKSHSYNSKVMNVFALNHVEFTIVKNCKTSFKI